MTGGSGSQGGEFRPDPATVEALEPMLDLLAASPVSLSSVTEPVRARDVHVADSLSGLVVPEVRTAGRVLDLGTGAGFPGIPLAFELPGTEFTLIDSVGRKVAFLDEVIATLSLENVTTLVTRSEDLARGEARESFDLVTARAVAPLDALAELGAPLLKTGGSLVAWKGEPEPEGEAAVLRTSDRTGMTVDRSVPVRPYSSSRERRLYILKKIAPTSDNLPRRPGLARKRPLAGRRSN